MKEVIPEPAMHTVWSRVYTVVNYPKLKARGFNPTHDDHKSRT